MDRLIRLLWCCLWLGGGAGLPGLVAAYGTVAPSGSTQVERWTGPPLPSGQLYVSAGSACGAWVTYMNSRAGPGESFTQYSLTVNEGAGTYSCQTLRTYRYCNYGGSYPDCNPSNPSSTEATQVNGGGSGTRSYVSEPGCPSNSTASGAQCVCDAGHRPNSGGTACVSYSCGMMQPVPGADLIQTNQSGGSFCLDGCRVVASLQFQDGGTGPWFARGPYYAVGATCEVQTSTQEPPAPTNPASAPEQLAPGKCPGEVNGQPVIVDCNVTDSTRVEVNPDGSFKEVSTRCQGGNCITTERNFDENGEETTPGTTTIGGTGGRTGGVTDVDNPGGEEGEEGECEQNPSASGCGGEGAAIGELYTDNPTTLTEVLTAFRGSALNTPIGSAVGGFFTVTGGGACPTFQTTIPYIEADVSLDVFCDEWVADALAFLQAAVLLVCSFFAFRVAIDN